MNKSLKTFCLLLIFQEKLDHSAKMRQAIKQRVMKDGECMVKADRSYLIFYGSGIAFAGLLIILDVAFDTSRSLNILLVNGFTAVFFLCTMCIFGWFFQRREQLRQRLGGMTQPQLVDPSIADNPEARIEIFLPWRLRWRANRIGYFMATGMQGFFLATMILFLIASNLANKNPVENYQQWQFVMVFGLCLAAFAALCAVAMAFILYRRIDVTETGLTAHYWGRTRSIRWEEARLFLNGGPRGYFELASADSIIRWSIWPPSMNFRYASATNEEIWVLHALISERTGLPMVNA